VARQLYNSAGKNCFGGHQLKVGDLVTALVHHWDPDPAHAIITKVYDRDDHDYYDIVFIRNGIKVSRSHCDMEIVNESR
jgi:hypothetical protein